MSPPPNPFRRPPPPPPAPPDPVEVALGYHERTKHHEQRFAASLGWLDWDNQPDPFRRHDGAPRVRLVRPRDGAWTLGPDEPSWADLLTPGAVPPRPLDAPSLARFLGHALALSAWKRFEASRWSLRVDPSSGNLHPTEGWLLLPALGGVCDAPALAHYAPQDHALELRATWDADAFASATASLRAGDVLVLLSSIAWREAWKYGERAWRYCRHDAGHALAALRYGAALCGWRLAALPTAAHAPLATLLGTDREDGFHPDERETPDVLAVLRTSGAAIDPLPEPDLAALADGARRARWHGTPNVLSAEHHPWDVIEVVEQATRRDASFALPHGPSVADAPRGSATPDAREAGICAARVIRTRRSAVAMDGATRLARAAFVRILARTLPALSPVPWDALRRPTCAHLLLFVHRVDDVPPGLYLLVRAPDDEPALRAALRSGFEWSRVAGVPDDVPLVRLLAGDLRGLAGRVSCGQDIAADGAFSVGMLARFEPTLRAHGAPVYPLLFEETGALGQTLYLEAEAAGLRATGIGCFFDDAVHALCGLRDRAFQSLYHFTVGGAVDDARLTTEPAYAD